jgi:large subunit ribosomal protein L31e
MPLERTYTIPLRRGWLKAPRYRRAKKAVNTVKEFLVRHMKSEDVRLGTYLNLEIWKHGMKNPPSRVKVNVSKDDKGIVRAELFGAPKVEEKKEEEKGIVKKIAEKVVGKKEEAKAEVKPVEAKVEAKPVEKKPETKPAEKKEAAKSAPAKQPTAEKKAVTKPAKKVESKPAQ